jgi:ADP-ribosylglycohydrolase
MLKDRILGSLLGAAVGDAMGAATELRTKELIKERFGGEVRTIIAPPDDTFARGSKAGTVTDDFSLIYYTVRAILENKGRIDETSANQALLEWAADERFYDKYAGPTTRAAVEKIKGICRDNPYDFICCDNAKASNGSAMKISPAGLFHPGNVDKAIESAMVICRPTHNNNLSISGACAVAAAVSEALREESNLYSVIQAGLYGAGRGEELCRGNSTVLAGPSVIKRMKLSVSIGMEAENLDKATTEIADIIGSGISVSEAVPAVFGILTAGKGNLMDSIIAAVNIGSDTDTIACMTGAILGAMTGSSAIPENYTKLIEQVNGFDIHEMADSIAVYAGA